jgi:hypothetical protein
LDRSVSFLISGLEFAGGCVDLGGFAVKEAVGQRATDALVKEEEHEGDAEDFVCQLVGITEAVAVEFAFDERMTVKAGGNEKGEKKSHA